MCVANKKWPSAEHTQTHMQGEEAAWQELTDSGRATVPVGWVRVGIKPKPGRMTSELYTSPTQPTGHASAKLTHTEEHTACCVVLLLTPWNCPLLSLPSPSLENTCGICGAVAYFGDIWLLWNMRLGDRNQQIFPWSNSRGHGSGRTAPTLKSSFYIA